MTGTPGRGARERGEDDQLGGAVGLGDRRGIRFPFDLKTAADDLEDRLAGVACSLADVVEQALAIHVSAAPSGCRHRAAPTRR